MQDRIAEVTKLSSTQMRALSSVSGQMRVTADECIERAAQFVDKCEQLDTQLGCIGTLERQMYFPLMGRYKLLKIAVWVCIVSTALCARASDSKPTRPKNLIMMISDGYGTCAHTTTNHIKEMRTKKATGIKESLALEDMLIGQITTF
eukprot:921942_1